VQACAVTDAESSPSSQRVELAAAADPASGGVTLWVRDDGPGIPAELRDKIWAPFFTTKAQGTGLGLAFVREIVEDHGGQIQLEAASEAPGTCFRIALPPAPAAASAPPDGTLSGGPTDALADDAPRPNPP
jgi:signal transduction histidine kinase